MRLNNNYMMIILTIIVLMAMLLASECSRRGSNENAVDPLKERKNDSLEVLYMETIDEINHQFYVLKESNKVIALNPNDFIENNRTIKERIKENIASIRFVLKQNEERINELNARLKNKDEQLKKMENIFEKKTNERNILKIKQRLIEAVCLADEYEYQTEELHFFNNILTHNKEKIERETHQRIFTSSFYSK